jgi:predicted Zn-dependent protease
MNNAGWLRLLPIAIGFVVIAVIATRGCQEGPFGRSRVITMSPEQELQLGRQAYQQILSKERGNLVHGDPVVEQVRDVGNRLRRAAEDPEVLKTIGVGKDLKLEWEFNVIRSRQVNAFCLPGGKVAVYTGILPVCRTEAGLAVVMGHEIGHALARHGAERMAEKELMQIGLVAAASSLGSVDPQKQQMIYAVLGAGAEVGVLLPFSRKHESEADHIGIILMAAAGYDPDEAPRFWMRMAEASKGGGGPGFLSTHPSHETRIHDLQRWAAEARPFYQGRPHAPDADHVLGQRYTPSITSSSVTKPPPKPKNKYEYGEVK